VIEASRAFVCIRPNTYESADEAKVLEGFFRGRSGLLENTTFVLLDSDGKSRLSRSGRDPQMVFRDADAFAKELREIAADHQGAESKSLALPLLADMRIALNVAACDSRALLVVHAKDEATLAALQARLAAPLWAANLPAVVRCVAVVHGKADPDTAAMVTLPEADGLSLIAPEPYGRKGTVLKSIAATAKDADVVSALREALVGYEPKPKDPNAHIREGNRAGIQWQTAIPVTDPGGRRGDGPPGSGGPGGRGGRGRGGPPASPQGSPKPVEGEPAPRSGGGMR
jgi:hypothetical protein